jgi:hypothetical protein
MFSKRPKTPRVSELNKFALDTLGYFYVPNVSPYELVARGLQSLGYARDDATSVKRFVLRNLDVMRSINEKASSALGKSRLDVEALKTLAQQQVPPSQPQSSRPRSFIRKEYATSKAFLDSFEWRQLRMVVLKKYGAKCQCCGATPATNAVINVDHIKPRRLFPELALDENNLQVLCGPCNHGKGNWDMTDWRSSHG